MSWFPVDDAFHSHPKARKAGMEAVGLWTLAGSHCMAYLTDGFVADWWVNEKPRGKVLAKRLIAADLWHHGENDGEQGFWFHDWKPECLKVNVLDAREKARLRKAKSRESHRESRVTDDETPASCLVPTQPNPTQPINPLETLGGGVALGDACDPRPTCSRHPNGNPNDEDCRGCGRVREWDKNHEGDALDAKRRLRESRHAAMLACPRCDKFGWAIEGNGLPVEPAVKCQHQEAS